MGDRALRHAASFPALVVAVALCAVLAACNTPTPSPAATGSATGAPGTATPSQPGAPAALRAYFGLGSTGGNPILAPVERPASSASAGVKDKAMAALTALVAGRFGEDS
jgi:hypothetical protein